MQNMGEVGRLIEGMLVVMPLSFLTFQLQVRHVVMANLGKLLQCFAAAIFFRHFSGTYEMQL